MAARYGWRPGSQIRLDPDAAGREMERVRKANGGDLSPEAVLDSAQSHNSALHDHFEWDDSAAATQHRLSQASELIRAITVDMSRSNVELSKPIRAFVSIEQHGKRTYTSTVEAMSDMELRQQILMQAFAELEALRKKYGELRELAGVFAAIDRARPAA